MSYQWDKFFFNMAEILLSSTKATEGGQRLNVVSSTNILSKVRRHLFQNDLTNFLVGVSG